VILISGNIFPRNISMAVIRRLKIEFIVTLIVSDVDVSAM
jgi:hypothetical protein